MIQCCLAVLVSLRLSPVLEGYVEFAQMHLENAIPIRHHSTSITEGIFARDLDMIDHKVVLVRPQVCTILHSSQSHILRRPHFSERRG